MRGIIMRDDLIRKARKAGSIDELIAFASSEGIELTRDKASSLFARLKSDEELSDDALGAVTGGKGESEDENANDKKCLPEDPAQKALGM